MDTKEAYIKVGYGDFEDPFVPMALVFPGEVNFFIIQFLVKKEEIDPDKRENYDTMIKELNFFMVELCNISLRNSLKYVFNDTWGLLS